MSNSRPSTGTPARLRVLALATSTDWCSAGLHLRDGDETGEDSVSERAGNEHSRRLLPMANTLLQQAGLRWSDLDVIAFDAGPGSFTGLRVGCGLAQGLAFALELPVVGVSSLEALAWQSDASFTIAAIDARMHEIYAAPFRRVDGLPELVEPIRVVPEAQAAEVLEHWWALAAAGASRCALGDAFARYPGLGQRLAPQVPELRADAYPRADAVAAIAARRFMQGRGLAARDAAPLYVRDKVALDLDEQQRLRQARARAATGAQ